jgi:hypothetical protein
VEKAVAHISYSETITHELIPTNYFGGQMAFSMLYAGFASCTTYSQHTAGLRTGILLFDIQGFFDNVNRARLVQVVKDLTDRTVQLRFNGCLSTHSPVLPALSVIYTSPFSTKAEAGSANPSGCTLMTASISHVGGECRRS